MAELAPPKPNNERLESPEDPEEIEKAKQKSKDIVDLYHQGLPDYDDPNGWGTRDDAEVHKPSRVETPGTWEYDARQESEHTDK